MAFDPLSAASTASEFTLRFLLNPERANRLVYQKSLDNKQIGLEELLQMLIDDSFGKTQKNGYLSEVQQMINQNVLKYVMNLASSNSAYLQTNAIAHDAIDKIAATAGNSAYVKQYQRLIKEFKSTPGKFELKSAPKIPDGSPIGTDVCSYNTDN